MATVTETLPAERHIEGTFIDDVDDEDLVYFLVNVGDGDMQLLLLPKREDGARLAVVVDAARGHKLNAFLDHLIASELLKRPSGGQELFPLVCATHPHHDHIAGMGAFINRWHADIGEFWEPGYYHPSGSFHEMMRAVGRHEICLGQPTSGFTRYIGLVRITVLTPGIQLRNRFDTYGIDINNSSLSLKVDFPAVRVEAKPGTREMHARRLEAANRMANPKIWR